MAEVLKNRDCKDCGCEITEHYKGKPWRCKPCSRAYEKAWRAANPDKCKLYDKRKRERNPSIYYNSRLRRTYGITVDEYNELLASQGNVCAICETTEPGNSNGVHTKFSVDHDHTTGEVRGLLCNNCNRGIGLLQDSASLLLQAHLYLSNK